jgi:hypothetical protein
MKQVFVASMLGFFSILLMSSCGKRLVGQGDIVSKTYSIENFSSINLSNDANVYYQKDSDYYVEVQAQQNVLDVMKVDKSGSELCIGFKNMINIIKHDPITVMIHSPKFDGATVSGSGLVKVTDYFESNSMDFNVSGSGEISVDHISASSLDATISGSGKIIIYQGESNNVTTKISGSGKADLQSVVSQSVSTTTSGSGSTKVWAMETLNATISGSGDVYYKGSPSVNSHISGSGKLIKL